MRGKTLICIGDNKMKRLLLGTILLALVFVLPIPTMEMFPVIMGMAISGSSKLTTGGI